MAGKKLSKSVKKVTSIRQGQKISSSRSKGELKDLALGESNVSYPTNYDPMLLESFDNKNPNTDAWTTFVCTEFTSLCPKTNQPDFAKIFVNYIADKKMVESKSMKLYLFSFRNHGDFHEDCVQTICKDIQKLIKPKYIEVIGEFTPRGGIAIFPYASAHNNKASYKKLHEHRMQNYAPGSYSFPMERIY